MDIQIKLSYQELKERIREKLNQTVNNFVEIGFRLRQIQEEELYIFDGYDNINEFAKAEYGLSQSDTSRFIAINEKFSEGGHSPVLLPEYEGYGSSKLSEMLSLTEEELKLISPRTTRVEIRQINQMKREARDLENDEIYAPAHNSESPDSTQSETDSEAEKTPSFPDGISLVIEFFKDQSRRESLKQLAGLLRDGTSKGSVSEAAAEIINPSGHLMFRKSFTILIFEEDHIKHSKFGSITTQFTYLDFLHDTALAFDMAAADPWVTFFGEPEPEPKQETKAEPPKQEKKETKTAQPAPKQAKKDTKPPVNTQSKPQPPAAVENPDVIPGQKEIEDYPELLPESSKGKEPERKCRVCGCTESHACEGGCYWVEPDLCSACRDQIGSESPDNLSEESENKEAAFDVEIIEADIVQTDPEECPYCNGEEKTLIEFGGLTVFISEGEIVIRNDSEDEDYIKINFCPICGKKLG